MVRRIQHERNEQEALIRWFALQHPKDMLMHIPNQLIRGCVQARVLCMSGVIPGAPDLFLCVAKGSWHGLFVELKRQTVKGEQKGVVSERQRIVMEHLKSKGYKCIVAFGWKEAKDAITDYMELKNG